jgi:hypothetical protein
MAPIDKGLLAHVNDKCGIEGADRALDGRSMGACVAGAPTRRLTCDQRAARWGLERCRDLSYAVQNLEQVTRETYD